jgi:hypothetical protein
MADPFHPQVQGVRVPQPIPRETATFSTFTMQDITERCAIIVNFENPSLSSFVKLRQDLMDIITDTP